MGLTVHFGMRLPGETPRAQVFEMLAILREYALTLHIDGASEIVDTWPEPETWDATKDPLEGMFRLWAEAILEFDNDGSRGLIDIQSGLGFAIHPGAVSEPASFGFYYRRFANGAPPEWYWGCSCKTQYASLLSEQHFLDVHKRLIAILDRAKALGIQVEVHDEGGYWETRDDRELVRHVEKMNHILARLAGKLSDMGRELNAPIFGQPRFERLERGE
jgi:hypothetical protein